VGMVHSYNDMLSRISPFMKPLPRANSSGPALPLVRPGRWRGGVPAMCDGVTQGEPGMELSLVKPRCDAMGTAVALGRTTCSNAALCLGVLCSRSSRGC